MRFHPVLSGCIATHHIWRRQAKSTPDLEVPVFNVVNWGSGSFAFQASTENKTRQVSEYGYTDLSQRRRRIPSQDTNLAARAKAAAGGSVKLASLFGVSKQAASEWGRVRPIPRHVRPQLERFVRLGSSLPQKPPKPGSLPEATPWESLQSLVAGIGLHLTPPANPTDAVRVEQAWREMAEKRRDEIRNYARRAAQAAAAIDQLLTRDSARRVIATLNTEVNSLLNANILRLAS